MQIPVPQFLDVEDKIIGPFTLKQFGFILGAGLLILGLFKIFGLSTVFYFLAIPIALIALTLTFGSFNGKKLYNAIPLFFKFFLNDHQYVFRQTRPNADEIMISPITVESYKAAQPKANVVAESAQSKLKKLSQQLDRRNQEEIEAFSLIRKQNGER